MAISHARIRRASMLVFGLVFGAASAHANLITNGDFETGNLAGWTTYTTTNGTIGPADVVPFNTTGAGASLAAHFDVGGVVFDNIPRGGGIFQTFSTAAGALEIRADIATASGSAVFGNASGGAFEMLLDGVAVAIFDFDFIDANSVERHSLAGTRTVSAGVHELRFLMLRPFLTSDVTPQQYIDNVVVQVQGVPEPMSLLLLAAALGALAVVRRTAASRCYCPPDGGAAPSAPG